VAEKEVCHNHIIGIIAEANYLKQNTEQGKGYQKRKIYFQKRQGSVFCLNLVSKFILLVAQPPPPL
jgi:hypothetical protein